MTLAPASKGHIPELDTLRALAVAMVLWHHWAPRYQFGIDWGQAGVTLFFVLSGFLITGILIDARASSGSRLGALGAFYARRTLRIFPLFYFVLAAAALLQAPGVRAAFPWHATFLSNFYFFRLGAWDGPSSHFWSIAVEEQFYIVWAPALLWLSGRFIVVAIAAIILSAPVFRSLVADLPLSGYTTPAVIDGLGIGALVSYLQRRPTQSHWHLPWAIGFGAAGAVCLVASPIMFRTGSALLTAAVLTLILSDREGAWRNLLRVRPVRYIGTISFGIYLYHNFSAFLLYDMLGVPKLKCRNVPRPNRNSAQTPGRAERSRRANEPRCSGAGESAGHNPRCRRESRYQCKESRSALRPADVAANPPAPAS